jgi:hypothetical protein
MKAEVKQMRATRAQRELEKLLEPSEFLQLKLPMIVKKSPSSVTATRTRPRISRKSQSAPDLHTTAHIHLLDHPSTVDANSLKVGKR